MHPWMWHGEFDGRYLFIKETFGPVLIKKNTSEKTVIQEWDKFSFSSLNVMWKEKKTKQKSYKIAMLA